MSSQSCPLPHAASQVQSVGGLLPHALTPGAAPTSPGAGGVLRGKNVALLCADPAQPEALLICRAAIELGAHVSLVCPQLEAVDSAKTAGTAKLLGRLYDALACVDLGRDVLTRLREMAAVPVLDDAEVRRSHLLAAGACAGAGDTVLAEDPRGLWQAALLKSLR